MYQFNHFHHIILWLTKKKWNKKKLLLSYKIKRPTASLVTQEWSTVISFNMSPNEHLSYHYWHHPVTAEKIKYKKLHTTTKIPTNNLYLINFGTKATKLTICTRTPHYHTHLCFCSYTCNSNSNKNKKKWNGDNIEATKINHVFNINLPISTYTYAAHLHTCITNTHTYQIDC